jgi:bacterioferritin-associated ferredoxin
MKVIEICPCCSNIGIEVEEITVEHLTNEKAKEKLAFGKKWHICSNQQCAVSYFSKDTYLTIDEINVPIWYKDPGPEVPICYCSKLTRGEIIQAVKNGCKTIDDVQKYTGKNTTGKCKLENPLGKCCRNVFISIIGKSSCDQMNENNCCGHQAKKG